MPKKPLKPVRPRDVNQHAKMVGDLATKQVEEPEVTPVNPKESKRGEARAAKLSAVTRRVIARKAAAARWKK
ncbi:MAG: hypothetical protein WD771_06565 [Gemmatimonadaceae bacterium]